MYFGGYVATMLWVPNLANTYGRLKIIKVSAALSVALYTAFIVSTSYKLTLASMFMMGGVHSARIGVGFPFLMELIGKSYRAHYSSVMNSGAPLLGVVGTLFFLFVSRNAYYAMAIGWMLQFTAFVGTLYLPESPVYLLHKGMIKEGKEALSYMA